MISAQTVRDRLQHRPFIPFRVITSAGYNVEIYHPEQIVVAKQTLAIASTKSADQKIYDHIITIGILHIAALEDLPVPAASGPNGTPSN